MLLPLNLSAWTVQVQVLVKAKRWDFAVHSRMVTAISAGAVTSARGPQVCSPVPPPGHLAVQGPARVLIRIGCMWEVKRLPGRRGIYGQNAKSSPTCQTHGWTMVIVFGIFSARIIWHSDFSG